METPSSLPNAEIYHQLIQDHVLFTYNGEIDGELIDMLVQLAEKILKKSCSKLKARKRIVNVLIESLQNSFHYTNHLVNSLTQDSQTLKAIKSPFLILYRELPAPVVEAEVEIDATSTQTLDASNTIEVMEAVAVPDEEDENYWILTGNWVDNANAQRLKSRIEELQDLSEDELQEQYIKSLNKEILPTAGGAGLGIIDIMRRAKRQVFFEFRETEHDFSVFMLKIKVN
jgi:Family of unknown function (DUF6272)